MPIPRSDRTGLSKKCCCEKKFCYLLSECEESITCPDNGVYVSQAALDYMLNVLFYEPPYGFPIVIQFNDGCCLYADASTDDTQYLITDIIDAGGIIIYAKGEVSLATIEDYEHIEECEVCEGIPTGACCYFFRNRWQCNDDSTQAECDDLPQGKWFGKGSECSDQDCTDPDPDCPSKLGLCLCGENNVATYCDDSDEDCSSTYSISITVPSFHLFHSTGLCGAQECPPNICPQSCTEFQCCDSGSVGGTSLHTTLTRHETFNNLWESPDETGTQPSTQVPQGEHAFGGVADSSWRTFSNPPCTPVLDPCHPSHPCQLVTCVTEPCASAAGYSCPCCHAYRFMTWWFRVDVSEVMSGARPTFCIDCGSLHGLDWACCDNPPCSVWQVKIVFNLMRNACEGDMTCTSTYQNPHYPPCDPNLYHSSSLGDGAFIYYVKKQGCSCPSGLTDSNAHWTPLSNLNFNPTNPSYPWRGVDDQHRYYPHCSQCGCDNWMRAGYNGLTSAREFVGGLRWTIT